MPSTNAMDEDFHEVRQRTGRRATICMLVLLVIVVLGELFGSGRVNS